MYLGKLESLELRSPELPAPSPLWPQFPGGVDPATKIPKKQTFQLTTSILDYCMLKFTHYNYNLSHFTKQNSSTNVYLIVSLMSLKPNIPALVHHQHLTNKMHQTFR